MLVARAATALAHAVFWALLVPVAVAAFPPADRTRAAGLLFTGISLAPVLGVPAGSWLGRAAGWPAPFWAVAGLALVALVLFGLSAPAEEAGAEDHGTGSAPSTVAYWSSIALTTLAVTAAFTAYTYFEPLLTGLGGIGPGQVSAFLLVFGLAGAAGTRLAGRLLAGHPLVATLVGPLGIGIALIVLVSAAPQLAVTVAVAVVWGLAMGAMPPVLQVRVLDTAPFDIAVASAVYVVAFNVAIGGGALIGAGLLDAAGPRGPAVCAAALALLAVPVAALSRPRR